MLDTAAVQNIRSWPMERFLSAYCAVCSRESIVTCLSRKSCGCLFNMSETSLRWQQSTSLPRRTVVMRRSFTPICAIKNFSYTRIRRPQSLGCFSRPKSHRLTFLENARGPLSVLRTILVVFVAWNHHFRLPCWRQWTSWINSQVATLRIVYSTRT